MRRWSTKFDLGIARRIRVSALARGDKWHLDEVVVTINGSVAISRCGENESHGTASHPARIIEMRQSKYLNNLIEQDHREIKRIVRPMLGFKNFNCARKLIAGIETLHMVKKGQLDCPIGQALSAADRFYSLAF